MYLKITKIIRKSLLVTIFSILFVCKANATLFDFGINVNGSSVLRSDATAFQPEVDLSLFDTMSGFGSIEVLLSGAGNFNIASFFDFELSSSINTFFNENGTQVGIAPMGLTWEIDEPGFLFGDIFTNWENGALDNSNGVPVGLEDDVSVALGWQFMLNSNEVASIIFEVSEVLPTQSFYLMQHDPESNETLYFSTSINISSTAVPTPSIVYVFALGLLCLGFNRSNVKL